MEDVKKKYLCYCSKYMNLIEDKYSCVKPEIKLKVSHGLVMSDLVRDLTNKSLMLNDSYINSAGYEGLLHDIARFPQYLSCETLKDTETERVIGFLDHGQYGRYLLKDDNNKLLRYFIEDESLYDFILTEVVGEHTCIRNSNYLFDIDNLKNIFQNYSMDEVFVSKNNDLINKLIALKIKLLQEADCLEILENVKSGRWKPEVSSNKDEFICDFVWDIFTNFKRIDMRKLKGLGLWGSNAGFLLRYSLLFSNFNLVGTLKYVLDSNIIDKVYEIQKENTTDKNFNIETDDSKMDPRVYMGYLYTKLAVNNLISCSSDGKIITDSEKNLARIKTLNMWKGY